MPPQTTNGPIDAVRCPHCGHPNDYRELKSQQLLDTGHTAICDRCRRVMTVVQYKTIEVVVVRQSTNKEISKSSHVVIAGRSQLPPPRRATTLSPGQTRRLLRGK